MPMTPESSSIYRSRAQEITLVSMDGLVSSMAGHGQDGSENEAVLQERKKIGPREKQHGGVLSLLILYLPVC